MERSFMMAERLSILIIIWWCRLEILLVYTMRKKLFTVLIAQCEEIWEFSFVYESNKTLLLLKILFKALCKTVRNFRSNERRDVKILYVGQPAPILVNFTYSIFHYTCIYICVCACVCVCICACVNTLCTYMNLYK